MVHTFTIDPQTYQAFESEAAQIEKCKEWGLLSEKASKTKTFVYKGHGKHLTCSIVGFVDKFTAVIAFDNDQLHCIHPSFLKEMQASTYTNRLTASADSTEADNTEEDTKQQEAPAVKEAEPEKDAGLVQDAEPVMEDEPGKDVEPVQAAVPVKDAAQVQVAPEDPPQPEAAPKEKGKKEKAQKLQLPEDKVKMTATVKEFTTVPNNFSDNDDEVIIYEAVSIAEPGIEVGAAWSSHSATLKKLELAVGDTITFEGKLVTKKLTKHPVPYKINNPAKIQKV